MSSELAGLGLIQHLARIDMILNHVLMSRTLLRGNRRSIFSGAQ